MIGWRSRVGDVKFDGFVFYQPNVQNGKGIASWETIWIQNLNKPVSGFQTIIMVRREHDLSSECTAPWRELNDLIGVGRYGETLISEKVSDEIRNGAVYLNGVRVDPFKTPMTKGFYLITYEFPRISKSPSSLIVLSTSSSSSGADPVRTSTPPSVMRTVSSTLM